MENKDRKMKTTNASETMRKGSRRKTACCDKEFEDLLVFCIGDERKSISCVENGASLDNFVSIRCRRHKNRFNVDKSWLKTSEWLCPKCYGKLSPAERLCYAPSGGKVDVKPFEPGRPVVYAECNSGRVSHNKAGSQEERGRNGVRFPKGAIEVGLPKGEEAKSKEKSKKGRKHAFGRRPALCGRRSSVEDGLSSGFGPGIAALLPTWRMKCKKCGKSAPVHKTYIDNNSSVLCPECFSHMTSEEVKEFSARNPSSTAELWQVGRPFNGAGSFSAEPASALNETHAVSGRYFIEDGDSSDIALGGCCSNSRILSMTLKELAEAVRMGKVSRARARIEIVRRRKSGYFNSLPDVEPISLAFPR